MFALSQDDVLSLQTICTETSASRVWIRENRNWAILKVSGDDHLSYLQGQLSCDVNALAVGDACYYCLLNVQGQIVSYGVLFKTQDTCFLSMDSGCLSAATSALQKYIITESVDLLEVSPQRRIASLWFSSKALAVEGFPFSKNNGEKLAELAGRPCCCREFPDGFGMICHVLLDADADVDFESWLQEQSPLVEKVSPACWEALRVLNGDADYPEEFVVPRIPQTLALEHSYSLKKGCFLGQEVVARLTYRSQTKDLLVGGILELSENCSFDGTLWGSARGEDNESSPSSCKEIGQVTTCIACPDGRRHFFLGVVKRRHIASDSQLLDPVTGAVIGRQVALPFQKWVHDYSLDWTLPLLKDGTFDKRTEKIRGSK